MLSENSQMKDGQSQHDDRFGYGIFKIDNLINSENSNSTNISNIVIKEGEKTQKNIFQIFQVERRMAASVPPDNSINAIE